MGAQARAEVKRSVRAAFGLATACYMATGLAAASAGAYLLNSTDTSRRTVIFTPNVLRTLLAAGAYIAATTAVGVVGALAPLQRKAWLVAYTWLLVASVLVETGIGIWMWSRALDVDDLFGRNWRSLWPDQVKRSFQDSGRCCGYLGPLDSPAPGSPSCAAAAPYGCMVSVQLYTRDCLARVYTWLFTFVLVAVVALLSVLVLLVVRNDAERLRWSRANAIFRSLSAKAAAPTGAEPKP